MKSFKQFIKEMGAGGAGGGGTTTAGVAGAGDNPEKIVPVSKKRQSEIQKRGEKSKAELQKQFRKIVGTVNV